MSLKKSDPWLFSPENSDIDKEIRELERARGDEREVLNRKFMERFYALMEVQSEWVKKNGFFQEFPCHSEILRLGEVVRQELEDGNDPTLGVALKSPRGRTKTPVERNERIKEAVVARIEAGHSLASASRHVAERMVRGEIPGLSAQGLASRTIENIYRGLQGDEPES